MAVTKTPINYIGNKELMQSIERSTYVIEQKTVDEYVDIPELNVKNGKKSLNLILRFLKGSVAVLSNSLEALKTAVNALKNIVGVGGIVESGNNVNGTYIKYADGSMICRQTSEVTLNLSAARGDAYLLIPYDGVERYRWTYPQPFIEPPDVTCNVSSASVYGAFGQAYTPGVEGVIFRAVGFHPNSYNVSVLWSSIAIGRWK